ncbi:MAG: hypothetical protein LBD29_11240 [Treponema sp.]|jgi:hypothetical protein|nr:hypothetical protein [Treponema sp.]
MRKFFNQYGLFALGAASLWVWTACSNVLTSPETQSDIAKNGVVITVAAPGGDSRTLFPHVDFTSYMVTFKGKPDTPTEGSGPFNYPISTGNTVEITDLGERGPWDVTATGYITFSDGTQHPAAMGYKEITIPENGELEETIQITAGMYRRNSSISDADYETNSANPAVMYENWKVGFFSYNVTHTSNNTSAANASLKITNLNHYVSKLENFDVDPVLLSYYAGNPEDDSVFDEKNLIGQPSASGTVTLTPGYYRVDLTINNSYQNIGLTEIIHIYSDMETKLEKDFTQELTKTITLSGTVSVDSVFKKSTAPPAGNVLQTVNIDFLIELEVFAYTDPNYIGDPIGVVQVDSYDLPLPAAMPAQSTTHNGTWSMTLPAFETATPLYLRVRAKGDDVLRDGIWQGISSAPPQVQTVQDINISGINLGNVTITLVELGGTVSFTGGIPLVALVYVYEDAEYTKLIGAASINASDGAWNMFIPVFRSATSVYLEVQVLPQGSTTLQKHRKGVQLIPAYISKTDITFPSINLTVN